MEQSPLINILTFGLPGNVTRPIYLEYNSRRRELDRIWANPENHYQELQGYVPTVEALLAISLFYRHVLGHIQGANSFYKTLKQHCGAEKECSISIGSTVLDYKQQRRLEALMISFNQIQDKYQIYPAFYEFSETAQFLKNCKDLLTLREYETDDTI